MKTLEYRKKVGGLLATVRGEGGLTREKWAEKAGGSPDCIASLEQGEGAGNLILDVLAHIAAG